MQLGPLRTVATLAVWLLATTTMPSTAAASRCGQPPKPTPIYKDPSYSIDERVEDLVSRMTLQDKAGQLYQTLITQAPANSSSTVYDYVVNKRMSHLNLVGSVANATATAELVNSIQKLAIENTPLGIPLTLSTDPRHASTENIGTGASAGSFSQWPETLGLAAIRDPALVRKFADVVRQEYLAVGFKAALHPQVDLTTDYRWARTAGTWGEDADLTASMLTPYILGLQLGGSDDTGDAERTFGTQSITTVTKHFPGGGPAEDGWDSHFTYGKNNTYPGDQLEYHLIPFRAAVAAGARQMMPSYARPMGLEKTYGYPEVAFGFNKPIITGLLQEQMGFDGIVLTDWGLLTDAVINGQDMPARAWGLETLTPLERCARVFDAGCDQLGGESDVQLVLDAVAQGLITESRLDISVRKLMKEKFILGLFDNPYVDVAKAAEIVGQEAFVSLGAEAQRRSYTLLTNNKSILPLAASATLADKKFYIEGFNATFMANRGLTVVETPEEADYALLRITSPSYPFPGGFEKNYPSGNLEFTAEEKERQAAIYATVPSIVDISFQRAVAIPEVFDEAAAVLGSYGSGADAFLDVVFGVAKPEGKLPFDLPRSQKAVEESLEDVPYDTKDPVFRFGHGLSYE